MQKYPHIIESYACILNILLLIRAIALEFVVSLLINLLISLVLYQNYQNKPYILV